MKNEVDFMITVAERARYEMKSAVGPADQDTVVAMVWLAFYLVMIGFSVA